jgi:hypothetical protein
MRTRRPPCVPAPRSAFAGFRFPHELIVIRLYAAKRGERPRSLTVLGSLPRDAAVQDQPRVVVVVSEAWSASAFAESGGWILNTHDGSPPIPSPISVTPITSSTTATITASLRRIQPLRRPSSSTDRLPIAK